MSHESNTTLLSSAIKILSPKATTQTTSLINDQTQLPYILDTLSRKNNHHIVIKGSQSNLFNYAFLETLASQLGNEHLLEALQQAYFIFLDINALSSNLESQSQISHELSALLTQIQTQNTRCLLAINTPLSFLTTNCPLSNTIKPLLTHEQWRILIITNNIAEKLPPHIFPFSSLFSTVTLSEPSDTDMLNILKTYRDELEQFHEIIIPEESFPYALSMARHFLPAQPSPLDQALQLLDSASARTHTQKQNDPTNAKPILTQSVLTQVISNWTQIPLTHLQNYKLHTQTLIQNMQKQIFGQDAALNFIGLALQYARMKLQNRSGPLCNFLFAGPTHVGKSETAYALAEQLFGHKAAILRIVMDKTLHPKSLADIRVMTPENEQTSSNLFEAIRLRPYAIVLLENINKAPAGIIDLFQDILAYGFATDHQGNQYDFRHAIIIMTTTLGAERIISLTPLPSEQENLQTPDLMQLVLNNTPIQNTPTQNQHLSPHELGEEIRPALETYFSSQLLAYFNIVPFGIVDYNGTEKIIRTKLKSLSLQLATHYSLELSYAPEVIRYLVQTCLWRNSTTQTIDYILNQTLYPCVAHELLSYTEDKNRPKRLLLTLNDDGQVLRCEISVTGDTTLYSV